MADQPPLDPAEVQAERRVREILQAGKGRDTPDLPRPKMRPKPETVATAEMVHADIKEISNRLARVTRISWATVFTTIGLLVLGGVIGGIYGLITFLDATPNPGVLERTEYIGALAIGLLIGAGGLAASFFMRKERVESVRDIKADLDTKLGGWELPKTDQPAVQVPAEPGE